MKRLLLAAILLLSLCFTVSPCTAQEYGSYISGFTSFQGYLWGTALEDVISGEGGNYSQSHSDQTPGFTLISYAGDSYCGYTVTTSFAFTSYGLVYGMFQFLPTDNNPENNYDDFCFIQFLTENQYGIPDAYDLQWKNPEDEYLSRTPKEYISLMNSGRLYGIIAQWYFENGSRIMHSLAQTVMGPMHALIFLCPPGDNPLPSPSPANPYAYLDDLQTYAALKIGDSGDEVQRMQRALIAAGYMTGKADGEYGAQTHTAIRSFQRDYLPGEPAYATPRTLAYLFKGPGKDAFLARFASYTPAPKIDDGVYIAPFSGIRYHEKEGCQGLKDAIAVILVERSDAQAQGLTECGYCRRKNIPQQTPAPESPSEPVDEDELNAYNRAMAK